MFLYIQPRVNPKMLVKKFAGVFLPCSLLLTGILGIIYYDQVRSDRLAVKLNEVRKVETQAKVIAGDFGSIVSDLMVLSRLDAFQDLQQGFVGKQQPLTTDFFSFSKYKRLYDQVRFLDQTGKEIIRVNFNQGQPSVVPQEKLQVQAKRYWFKDTLRLNQGEVFVSPLDLNIERGKVEQPLKPMIRFGTPIVDKFGQKQGIVVLNYFGKKLLDNFTQISSGLPSAAMLVNANGYWLKGVQSEDEWGFMFPDRQNRTFQKTFPLAWQQIAHQESGQFQTREGLFSFVTVYPLSEGQKSSLGSGQAFAPSPSQIDAKSYYWKVISWVSPERLTARSNNFLHQLVLLYTALMGLTAIGSWHLAKVSAHRELTQIELKQSEAQLRDLIEWENKLKTLLSSQISSSLDLKTVISTAVAEVRGLLQIDRCQFLWYFTAAESTWFELSSEVSHPDLLTPLECDSLEKVKVLSQAILNNQLLRLDNIAIDSQPDTGNQELLQNLGLSSLLVVPILTYSGRQGVLVCENTRDILYWKDNEVELIQRVTNQLAIAIDQAHLYEQSRAATTAATIQAEQLQKTLHQLQQAQTQLIQNEKMSSLGQMVAGIAHEINNPVNFIHGNLAPASEYTQDLLRLVQLYQQHYPHPVAEIQKEIEAIDLEFLQQDLLKTLQSMKVGTQRIREIVQSLRSFSRLDEAEYKYVDIHEGIESTLMILNNRLKSHAGRSDIQVFRDYGKLPLVECNPGQLNQVFMNILVNAIDAMEEREQVWTLEEIAQNPSAIRITTEFIEDEKAVRIKIRDNGLGIPETVKNRIFDPFFTTKAVGKGTGLGMSISYQIVTEKHKGAIWCISEPDQGTEFRIQLPIQQQS